MSESDGNMAENTSKVLGQKRTSAYLDLDVDLDLDTINDASEFKLELAHKRQRTMAHREPDKFCMIIGSDAAAFTKLQREIIKFILKSGEIDQLNYTGYDKIEKNCMYSLVEYREYTFESNGKKFTACVEPFTREMPSSYDMTQSLSLFIKGDLREDVEKFVTTILVSKPVYEIYQFSIGNKAWLRVGIIKNRPHDTLVLKEGVLDDLLEDLDSFNESKKEYTKYGIPYKRVYLFHGDPGTGKSSLAQIMAHRSSRSLYVLSFDPKMTDDDLSNAIRNIPSKKGILLLEDIDCLFKARDTNQNLTSVSFSSLLNNLDGAIINKGLITIITTNHVNLLDPALRRPLRVDKTIKFERANHDQLRRLIDLYKLSLRKTIIKKMSTMVEMNNLTPAAVTGFLFRYRNSKLDDSNIIEHFKKYLQEISVKDETEDKSLYT